MILGEVVDLVLRVVVFVCISLLIIMIKIFEDLITNSFLMYYSGVMNMVIMVFSSRRDKNSNIGIL